MFNDFEVLRIKRALLKYEGILKKIGRLFSISALIYVVYYISRLVNSIEINIFRENLIFAMALFVMVSTSFIYINAYAYKSIVSNVCESEIRYRDIADLYVTSNIYKYLPGNVVHFIGRNVIAKKYDIDQNKIALSTMIEILVIITTTISFLITIYMVYLDYWIWALLLLLLSMFIFFKKRLLTPFCLILFSIFLNNCMVVILYNMYEGSQLLSSFSEISMIQSASWLIGFLTPGVPGGIGVKEFFLIQMSPQKFVSIMAIVAVVHRIILVCADCMGYLLLLLSRSIEAHDMNSKNNFNKG